MKWDPVGGLRVVSTPHARRSSSTGLRSRVPAAAMIGLISTPDQIAEHAGNDGELCGAKTRVATPASGHERTSQGSNHRGRRT